MEPVRVQITRRPEAEDLPLPARATVGASGFDLPAAVDGELKIEPRECQLIPTGFHIAVPRGFEAQVRPRSGLALKHQIILPNAPGTIDSDYRGELKVILMNLGNVPYVVSRGDRIAQLVICPVASVEWEAVEGLDETERGAGGFGHTGRSAIRGSKGEVE